MSRINEKSSIHLSARFGKLWSCPTSILAIGNDKGAPPLDASSNTIVIASMNTTISFAWIGEMFCNRNSWYKHYLWNISLWNETWMDALIYLTNLYWDTEKIFQSTFCSKRMDLNWLNDFNFSPPSSSQ